MLDGTVEGPGTVFLFFVAYDICGAAVADKQICAVVRFEKGGKRLYAANDQEQVILIRQRENRVDQIIAGAALTQIDF